MRSRAKNPALIPSRYFLVGMILIAIGLSAVTWFSLGEVWVRTVGLGLAASAIAVPLGLVIFWSVRNGGRFGQLLLLASLALALLPMVVHVSGWDAAIGKLGWLSTSQGNVLVPLVSGWWAAVWVHGIVASPQIALVLIVCDFRQGRIYEEQALLDAGSWTTFSRVTLWRFAPAIFVGALWVIISCAREITVVDLYQVETFAEQIYLGYSLGNGSPNGISPNATAVDFEINYGWQTPLVYIATVALIGAIAVFMLADLVRPKQNDSTVPVAQTNTSAKMLSLLLLVLLVVVPIANVIVRASFYVDSNGTELVQRYSLVQAWQSMQKSWLDYRLEMFWSTMISVAASTVAVIVSLGAVRWANPSRLRQAVFLMVVATGLALPGPVVGSWLNELFSKIEMESVRYWTDYTIFAPVVANVIFTGPLIAIMIWFVLKRTPESVEAAGKLDGAGQAVRFWQIDLAGNWMPILGCWVLGCVFCFGELAASQMVRPAGMDTVPRKMLGDLHAGVNELTAGATMLVALFAVVLTIVGWTVIKVGANEHGR